ncbi:MAG: hypothetical protein NT124_03880 [Candidatus Dependentiae bacterium]|nr:hypothetical protein [Candidatus Dependentiae bacterium]
MLYELLIAYNSILHYSFANKNGRIRGRWCHLRLWFEARYAHTSPRTAQAVERGS